MKSVATDHEPSILQRMYNRAVIAVAGLYRSVLTDTCVIAVSGSCAKTTTTTLLAGILAAHAPTITNPQSKNRTMDVARTLLKTRAGQRYCVLEIGAQGPGSLSRPLKIARPKVAVMTTIMNDHYSNFRGRQGVAKEKARLVRCLPADGIAVLNMDDPLVAGMREQTRADCVTYGTGERADIRMVNIQAVWPEPLSATLIIDGHALPLRTGLFGRQSATAVMAALAAACALGIPSRSAIQAVAKIATPPHRMQAVACGSGVDFILDDIKAPLDAIPALLQFTAEARARRKIFILGQLSDYAGSSAPKYRRTARQALAAADMVMLVGKYAQNALKGQSAGLVNRRLFGFQQLIELQQFLRHVLEPGDLVVLKGSFKQDHMERLIMAQTEPVTCWRMACGRISDCRHCEFGGRS